MAFLSQYQFWFGVLNICLIVGVGVINVLNHQKIVGNDLVHLSKDVKELSDSQEKLHTGIADDIKKIHTDIGFIKGKLEK